MKKLAFLAVMASALTFAACNNNAKQQTAGEQVDNAIDSLDRSVNKAESEMKEKVDKAQKELDEAIARGDKKRKKKPEKLLMKRKPLGQKPKKPPVLLHRILSKVLIMQLRVQNLQHRM